MKSIMRYVTNKNHKYDQKYILRKKGEERGRNYFRSISILGSRTATEVNRIPSLEVYFVIV